MRSLRAAVIALVLCASPAAAQLENVGSLSFPTSGSAEAQKHFLRGVAILHSFGWKQAIAEFQAAQKLQPDFALAYWGETLCYNHPLNAEQDAKNPRAVLARLGAGSRLAAGQGADAAREGLPRGGRGAVGRRARLARPARRLHAGDGAAPPAVPGRRRGDDVLRAVAAERRPGHQRRHVPAGDDAPARWRWRWPSATRTIRARRTTSSTPSTTRCTRRSALDAAFVYAKIVPAVSHAVHMPTHIFIQHGMWNEVAHQNVRAFGIAKDLFEPGDTPGDLSHSGDWGQYGFLQLGDFAGARERIRAFEELLTVTKHPRAVGTLALVKRPLHHRDRGVEGAAGGRRCLGRDDPGQRDERGEDRRPGHRREDGGAADRQGAR